MRLLVMLLGLFLLPAAVEADVWHVDYISASNPGGLYGDGSYIFVCCESTNIVYGIHEGSWVRLPGYYVYGQTQLPSGIPQISLTPGNPVFEAVAYTIGGGGGGAVVATPELAILHHLPRHIYGRELAALVNPTLQRLTAWAAAKLIGGRSRGVFIHLRSLTLEVQEWCSGLVTAKWLTVVAVVLACFVPSWPGRIALVIAAPLIGIECNILRVAAVGVAFDQYQATWAVKEPIAIATMAFAVVQVTGLGLAARLIAQSPTAHSG